MKEKLISEIFSHKNDKLSSHHMKFFKTGKGEYGEGDKFIGLKIPLQREIAKKYYISISNNDIKELLVNPYHEIRMTALFIMIFKAKKELNEMIEIYLNHLDYINNWDLVDLSASYLLGKYTYEQNKREILYSLSKTNHLWSERVSVVASHYFIKRNDFKVTFDLAEHFLNHKHDLMHKACGWMLREIGKIDENALCDFLDKFYKKMPRTMLRYAIERFEEGKRKHYMKK